MPPQSAERVSRGTAPKMWVCTSTAPGSTRQPDASTTSAPARSTWPTAAITPSRISTSPAPTAPGRRSVPPTTAVARGSAPPRRAGRGPRRAAAACSRAAGSRAPRDRPRLADRALVEHEHGVGDAGDDAQVVGDEEHATGCSSRCSSCEQLEHRRLHRDVERRGDLVADQQRLAPPRARGRSRRAGARRRRARPGSARASARAAAPARAARPPRGRRRRARGRAALAAAADRVLDRCAAG